MKFITTRTKDNTLQQAQELYPSIWRKDFNNKREFDQYSEQLAGFFQVADYLDEKVLNTRHPIDIKAFCSFCRKPTSMTITWHYCGTNSHGSVNPAWTEMGSCHQCGLNSRMRAVIDFLHNKTTIQKDAKVYLAERITPTYKALKDFYKDLTTSEYISRDFSPGSTHWIKHAKTKVRHEDLTRLSFEKDSFDLVITQDVFEHIPDYETSFTEICRVLKQSGALVFTVPFFSDNEQTCIRARIDENGAIDHLLPAEIHGNPTNNQGALCFQNFGWDLLESIRKAGFSQAHASLYWGPWKGHLGYPFFVFSAVK